MQNTTVKNALLKWFSVCQDIIVVDFYSIFFSFIRFFNEAIQHIFPLKRAHKWGQKRREQDYIWWLEHSWRMKYLLHIHIHI